MPLFGESWYCRNIDDKKRSTDRESDAGKLAPDSFCGESREFRVRNQENAGLSVHPEVVKIKGILA